MIVTCPKCDHTWESRTRSPRLSCSRCNHTFMRPAPSVQPLGTLPGAEPCDLCGHEGIDYHVCRVDGDAAIVCSACLRKLANEAPE